MPFIPNVNPQTQHNTPTSTGPGSAGTGGGYSQAQIAATVPVRPQEMVELFEQNSKATPATVFYDLLGMKNIVAGTTTGHNEAVRSQQNVRFGAILAGGGAGQPITIEIDPASTFTANIAGVLVPSTTIIAGDSVYFKDALKTQARVQSVSTSPPSAVLEPSLSTSDLAALGLIVPGEAYLTGAPVFGDAATVPSTRAERFFTYKNSFWYTMTAAGSTERGLATQPYFQALAGQDVPLYERQLKIEMEKHEIDKSKLFYIAKPITNISASSPFLAYNVPVTGTEGLFEFLDGYAARGTYNIGSYSIENFFDVTNYLNGELPFTRSYMVSSGDTASGEIWRAITDFAQGFSHDGLQVAMSDGQELNLNFGFREIQNMPGTGYNFVFYTEQLWSDSEGMGAAGYGYREQNIFTPIGYAKDAVTQNPTYLVGFDVMGFNGYVRENLMLKYDGSGYSEITNLTAGYTLAALKTDMAPHFACGNQMFRQVGI